MSSGIDESHTWIKSRVETKTCGLVPLGNTPIRARNIPAVNRSAELNTTSFLFDS